MWFSFHSNSIPGLLTHTTEFCTCHDSSAVMACAKYCSVMFIQIWMRTKLFSIEFQVEKTNCYRNDLKTKSFGFWGAGVQGGSRENSIWFYVLLTHLLELTEVTHIINFVMQFFCNFCHDRLSILLWCNIYADKNIRELLLAFCAINQWKSMLIKIQLYILLCQHSSTAIYLIHLNIIRSMGPCHYKYSHPKYC